MKVCQKDKGREKGKKIQQVTSNESNDENKQHLINMNRAMMDIQEGHQLDLSDKKA